MLPPRGTGGGVEGIHGVVLRGDDHVAADDEWLRVHLAVERIGRPGLMQPVRARSVVRRAGACGVMPPRRPIGSAAAGAADELAVLDDERRGEDDDDVAAGRAATRARGRDEAQRDQWEPNRRIVSPQTLGVVCGGEGRGRCIVRPAVV